MSGNGNNGRNGKTFGHFPARFEFRATASFDVRVRAIQKRTGVSRERIIREAAARGILDTAHSLRLEKRRNEKGRGTSPEDLHDYVPHCNIPPDPAFWGEQ